jgi:flagellar hook-basal body complex protein FliE
VNPALYSFPSVRPDPALSGPVEIPSYELGRIAPSAPQQPAESFGTTLGRLVNEVSAKQTAASDAATGLLSGDAVPLHQAMIAMEEASVSFQLMVEVRNKLLESYQELMRMQV